MTPVHVEDLAKGDHCTVVALHSGEASPLIGAVLEVQAVDFPFVAAHVPAFHCVVGLDTRVLTLERLSPGYVTAMTTPVPCPVVCPNADPTTVEEDT